MAQDLTKENAAKGKLTKEVLKGVNKDCNFPFQLAWLQPKFWGSWVAIGMFFIIAWIPKSMRAALGKAIGRWQYRKQAQKQSKRYLVVKKNLKLVSKELFKDKTSKKEDLEKRIEEHYQWHFQGLLDYSVLFFRSKKWLRSFITLSGSEHISNAINNDQNVIILLAHSVGLDFAPAALSERFAVYGSYHKQKNPIFNWLMSKARCRHVEHLIERDEGMNRLVRLLKPGKVMIFLPDEDLGRQSSEFVPFYGVEKATLNTPVRIAKLKKAICFPVFSGFDNESCQYIVSIGEKLEFDYTRTYKENVVLVNKAMESVIQKHPLQYMWMLKLFKTQSNSNDDAYLS